MGRKSHYYKSPQTYNEAKQNQEGWCRPKRRPAHLADSWDDRPHGFQKSWKKLRKTKYHPNGRGQKHTEYIENGNIRWWRIIEYFREHNIPHVIESVREPYKTSKQAITQRIYIGKKPVYHYVKRLKLQEDGSLKHERVKELWFYNHQFENIVTGYRTVTYYHTKGWNVTWWSDKDIGFDYIVKRCFWW